MRGNCLKLCQWRLRWEKFLPCKGCQALDQAASEVAPSLEVSARCADRALRLLLDLAVFGQQLDWILKGFSNPNNSIIISIKTKQTHGLTSLQKLDIILITREKNPISVDMNYCNCHQVKKKFNQRTFLKAFVLSPAFPMAKPARQKKAFYC